MTALPAAADFIGASITEAQFKTAMANMLAAIPHADTLDGYHAQKTPAADRIPVAGSDGKIGEDWLPPQSTDLFAYASNFGVGTHSFTVPDGVNEIGVNISGGGGASGASSSSGAKYTGAAGQSSSFGTYLTATGGAGGPASGGTGANGTLSASGTVPYSPPWGGRSASPGGTSIIGTGGNGGVGNVRISVTPGDVIPVVVGAGGAAVATSGTHGVSGQPGGVSVFYIK